ncbi:MAG: outer membrane beta-barrel protein [Phenylobacterium sp.]|uniref:hypothetical protein n=1 Tax=Phenylobacterium sp. TaxID=1871053 RepID=UPI001A5ADB86|nr:hypothetical protein [Phenylobacterium sp.]MBL8770969.1 outer membrane beta-barrel protein [Phenylobacterium sp.]
MRLRPLIFVAVATAGASFQAAAQVMPTVPAAAAQREVKIGVRAGVTYDSNVARADRATAIARDIKAEDYTFRPQAVVSITQPVGQQMLVLQGAGGYDFYRHNTRLNRQRVDVTGAGVSRVLGCQETVFASYRASQSELQDLDLGTSKNLLKTNGVGVGIACGRPDSLQGNIVVQKTQAKNSAGTRKLSDSDGKVLAMTLAYGRPSLGTATVLYTYSDAQFPNRIIPGRPVGDGFFTETLGLGYERQFGQRILVSGMVSRTELKREFAPPGLPLKLTTTTYVGSAEYRPSNRLTISADVARQIVPSQRTGKLYDITTAYNGVIRYELGTRFTISAGDSYLRSTSNTDTISAMSVITRSRANTIFGSIAYRQSERTSFLFDVRQEDRKTNLVNFNYNDTRVGLSAEVSF